MFSYGIFAVLIFSKNKFGKKKILLIRKNELISKGGGSFYMVEAGKSALFKS